MVRKRAKQILWIAILLLGSIYLVSGKRNSSAQCVDAAGVGHEISQSCEGALQQTIYENLAADFPITIVYPDTNKQENLDGSFYLRGDYQALLQPAAAEKEALYERASLHLNMSKMVLLTKAKTGTIYFSAPFIVNSAGSGVYVYVGLFSYDLHSKSSRHLDSVSLGDRIREEKITLLDNMIRVDFLDHSKDQAMAEYPNEPREISLQLLNLAASSELPKFKQVKRMHSSWDKDQDGINDCEDDGSCDHTVDYSKVRPE